jgi:hypothetical protein
MNDDRWDLSIDILIQALDIEALGSHTKVK